MIKSLSIVQLGLKVTGIVIGTIVSATAISHRIKCGYDNDVCPDTAWRGIQSWVVEYHWFVLACSIAYGVAVVAVFRSEVANDPDMPIKSGIWWKLIFYIVGFLVFAALSFRYPGFADLPWWPAK